VALVAAGDGRSCQATAGWRRQCHKRWPHMDHHVVQGRGGTSDFPMLPVETYCGNSTKA